MSQIHILPNSSLALTLPYKNHCTLLISHWIKQTNWMIMISHRFFTLILLMVLASTKPWTTQARPLSPTGSLVRSQTAHLEYLSNVILDDPTCWDSLIELSACTGEVIMFFLNGETYLGPSCCEAIRTIDSRCSPVLIRTLLGYTTEEEDVLEGYCDAKDSNGSRQPIKASKKVGDSTISSSP